MSHIILHKTTIFTLERKGQRTKGRARGESWVVGGCLVPLDESAQRPLAASVLYTSGVVIDDYSQLAGHVERRAEDGGNPEERKIRRIMSGLTPIPSQRLYT